MGNYASDLKNARRYAIKLSRNTDAALIEHLDKIDNVQGYIKSLIRADIEKGEQKMSREISLDNGMTYLTAAEAIETIRKRTEGSEIRFKRVWENITYRMDDDIREKVNYELAPCTEEEFLERYLELAPDDLTIG